MDTRWKDHLYSMDSLREGIGLRAYGQRNPLVEYQHEAFNMFENMIGRIKEEALEMLFKVQAVKERPVAEALKPASAELIHPQAPSMQGMQASREERSAAPKEPQAGPGPEAHTYKRETPKVGRNDPCPCGSGKKYKKCCGK
jgi:preprotein translocase subunit SecA